MIESPLIEPQQKPQRCANMIAVASGKGGVGKTWLSVTLSHALARKDGSVLLFDGARVTEIEVHWAFDDIYSGLVAADFDGNGDGVIDKTDATS